MRTSVALAGRAVAANPSAKTLINNNDRMDSLSSSRLARGVSVMD
jgi:hypothetical protein